MKPLKLKVYVADKTGEMKPDRRDLGSVKANDLDKAMAMARELLFKKGYPPIRSINAAPGDLLLVYCEAPAQKVDDPAGLLARFKKPPKLQPDKGSDA